MKAAIALSLALPLAGCVKPLTNEEIIRETEKCAAAGMGVNAFYSGASNFQIQRIECNPHKKPATKDRPND